MHPLGCSTERDNTAPGLQMRPVDGIGRHTRHALPKSIDTVLQGAAATGVSKRLFTRCAANEVQEQNSVKAEQFQGSNQLLKRAPRSEGCEGGACHEGGEAFVGQHAHSVAKRRCGNRLLVEVGKGKIGSKSMLLQRE